MLRKQGRSSIKNTTVYFFVESLTEFFKIQTLCQSQPQHDILFNVTAVVFKHSFISVKIIDVIGIIKQLAVDK